MSDKRVAAAAVGEHSMAWDLHQYTVHHIISHPISTHISSPHFCPFYR